MTAEHTDLLTTLAAHRQFLRFTAQGLTDEQARQKPCSSELSVGGLVKHVAAVEHTWARFIVEGAGAFGDFYDMFKDGAEINLDEMSFDERIAEFTLLPDETLEGVLDEYARVAAATDEIVSGTSDLSVSHPLPTAPWFEPGASWSARRAVLHMIAETAQHAGHADILRETIDGQRTMG